MIKGLRYNGKSQEECNCLHDVDPALICAARVSEQPATSIFRIDE